MLTEGRLNAYLCEIYEQAQEMMATLVEQVARVQGIDDHLNTTDQMRWVQMMNNVRAQAEEIVAIELLYV